MKDDVEIPDKVPVKRRALHDALDKWIAVWLARDDLTARERKRLEEEKARRRAVQGDPVTVGVLVGAEGTTPLQLAAVRELVHGAGPAEVLAPGRMTLGLAPGVFVPQPDLREIVRGATLVVAAPKTMSPAPGDAGVWDMIRYAKHRRLPVRVVLPDGQIQRGDDEQQAEGGGDGARGRQRSQRR